MKNEEIEKKINDFSSGISKDEIKELRDLILNKPDDSNENMWAEIILNGSIVFKNHLGNEKAIELLNTAYNEYKEYYPNSFQNKAKILKKTCYFQLEDKKLKDAHETMNKYLYNALGQVKFGQKNKEMHYFSFRSISPYSINELKEEIITLAHPRMFNDPLDTILFWWLENEIKNGGKNELDLNFRLLMKKSSEHIKLRCLIGSKYKESDKWKDRTVEDLSSLMWAHYADSHKGMCIEYEFEKQLFQTNTSSQEEMLTMIVPMEYVSEFDLSKDELSMNLGLFTKSDFWEYENEMRLCYYNVKETIEYPIIKKNVAIKAVYLGVKCSDEDRRKIEIAIGDKDIPLYQMVVDESLLTRLKKIQIG